VHVLRPGGCREYRTWWAGKLCRDPDRVQWTRSDSRDSSHASVAAATTAYTTNDVIDARFPSYATHATQSLCVLCDANDATVETQGQGCARFAGWKSGFSCLLVMRLTLTLRLALTVSIKHSIAILPTDLHINKLGVTNVSRNLFGGGNEW